MKKKNMKKKSITMRDLLAEELLDLCMTTNGKLKAPESAEPKFSKEKIESLKSLATLIYQDATYGARLMQFAAVLLDAPELGTGASIFPLFSVIVLQKAVTGHRYKIGKPHIVIHSENRRLLSEEGKFDAWVFDLGDEPKLATDEQIVEFINNLNDAQWKAITTNPLFNPLAQAILDRTIEVKEEEPSPKLAVV